MMEEKIVAIHQPNFLPWLGFFHKMVISNTFLILDNVQIQKTGGSYSNRVQFLVGGEAQWVTVPIVRNYHGTRAINEIEINYKEPWREKLLKTIQTNYGRTPHFEEIFFLLRNLLASDIKNLSEFNIKGITDIQKGLNLGVKTTVIASSVLTKTSSTELLIELTKACGGTIYLSGGGADSYQDKGLFDKEGIKLQFQNFKHPTYEQKKLPFIPGLSIVDALMHLGWQNTRLLLEGRIYSP